MHYLLSSSLEDCKVCLIISISLIGKPGIREVKLPPQCHKASKSQGQDSDLSRLRLFPLPLSPSPPECLSQSPGTLWFTEDGKFQPSSSGQVQSMAGSSLALLIYREGGEHSLYSNPTLTRDS